jgi:hypothetical protein
MTYVLCPYCHCSAPASDYLLCDDPHGSRFLQCPACDACIPLPTAQHHEVPLVLETA